MIRMTLFEIRLVLFLVALVASFQLLAEEQAAPFSEAETLLWLTDQLKSIRQPAKFTYEFTRTGTFEPGFSDTVQFLVNAIKDDGMKSATLEFFTGPRRFEVPAAQSTNVNPVLKIYLQGDVYEMNRLTDSEGKSKQRWRYFQRRIKFSLAESAQVEKVTVSFNGQDYAGHKVSFLPYLNDEKLNDPSLSDESTWLLFQRLTQKRYSVIIAGELPGYLYEIKTLVPGGAAGSEPLVQEVLRLVSMDVTAPTGM